MKLSRLSVLSAEEIRKIHDTSMRILETVGVKVDHGKAREILVDAGPVPVVLIVLAILCAWRYPIGRSQHAATLERLAAGE